MDGKYYIGIFVVLCLAWQAQAQQAVNCSQTGVGRFPTPGDTTCKNYTYCVAVNATGQFFSYNYVCPTTSLFNPATGQCTTNYVCNVTATTPTPTTTNPCTAEGFVADPSSTDCTGYIQCVAENGAFTQYPATCPQGLLYNPTTTFCDPNYTCTLTCTATGRFPAANTNCRNYFLCVLANNGTYVQYPYTCPSTSVFNPTTGVCTTSYTCTTT